jgi:hypothetical protein
MRPPHAELPDRERFLAAVAEQVPVDRVVEVYLFQPIRQGGVESGVAVIAAAGDAPVVETPAAQADAPGGSPSDVDINLDGSEPRYTVFTARYRHVLKGPERGRWEVSVVAEADAPLATVGAVVRGVQRRAGDVEPPEHISGDALRGALGQGPSAEP